MSFHFQCLTPNMQSPTGDPTTGKVHRRLLGPSLGDQQQGSFSINLWKNAFQDALRRLCPVREGGHECGCLPVLARKVLLWRATALLFARLPLSPRHGILTPLEVLLLLLLLLYSVACYISGPYIDWI